ncbi:MAG TPA: LysR family transcriptional regulator [Steroidobacteraceae bacterium]|nr:LysR family transcriptional regulator [Steroidobacteraceae bacterium]
MADVQAPPQGRAGPGPTMTRARVARRAAARPTAAVRFRVDFGRDAAVGPGKIALLELIGQEGSLSRAARALNMSYRRAWLLLESLNGSFAERVAVTAKGGRGGGGATLTLFGRRLIRAYRELDAEIQARAARRFRPILRHARNPAMRLKDR